MNQLSKLFPFITEKQLQQFEALPDLYRQWNEKINVVSRKDIDNLYEHHILHSLGIAKVIKFAPQTDILDVGTGGGFPGIPLAILFPETNFYLIDSIGKKIKVVQAIADAVELENVKAEQIRAENVDMKFDFIVSRAVAGLPEFYSWVKNKISKIQYHKLHNGILYLKGGDLGEELKSFGNKVRVYDLNRYFEGEFFETKKVVYLPFK